MDRLLIAREFSAGLRKSLICIRPVDRLAGRGLDGNTRAPLVSLVERSPGDHLGHQTSRLGSLLVQLKRHGVIEGTPGALRLTDIAALETLAGKTGLRDYKDPISRDVLTLER